MSTAHEPRAALPVAILFEQTASARTPARFALAPRDLVVGRDDSCDVGKSDLAGVSRRHARFAWRDEQFHVEDLGSTYGTFVNGAAVRGQRPIADRDRLRLGETTFVLRYLAALEAEAAAEQAPAYVEMLRDLATLDPARVVARGLELVRLVSGVDRSFLVDARTDRGLAPLLTSLSDPELNVSRSVIDEAIGTGRTVSHFLAPDTSAFPTRSMEQHALRRIWVTPIPGADDRVAAVLYLDSPAGGGPFRPEVEDRLVAVARHIGLALRNASLYAEVVGFTHTLEGRVADRTAALERSQAQLVAQDRLATLGRLVAAIAHELNNPAAAIVSFSGTLREVAEPVTEIRRELAGRYVDAAEREAANALMDAAARAARGGLMDTRTRRALEERLSGHLAAHEVPSATFMAQRLARIGLDPDDLEPALGVLRTDGERLTLLAEQTHTFERSIETIEQCAINIARIVDGLKTYAHLDRSEAEVTDLRRSIDATLSVLGATMPKGIEVVTRFDAVPPFAHRPGEMTQVWTNLIDNAVRAMGEHGTLAVETHDEPDRVRVTVTDDGPGVPDEVRERIFDLDVTTRGPGAGLGLGLPICRTIVERNHGGTIAFESVPGRTVFTVTLPKRSAGG